MGGQPPVKKKNRTGKHKIITAATRANTRVPRDGVPIATKAMMRVQQRDELTGNPFTILNNTSNTLLKETVMDLDIEANDFDNLLNAFKAEELVRADLAQANYKIYLDKLSSKSYPQGEEDVLGLSLEPIDNRDRNLDDLREGVPSGETIVPP